MRIAIEAVSDYRHRACSMQRCYESGNGSASKVSLEERLWIGERLYWNTEGCGDTVAAGLSDIVLTLACSMAVPSWVNFP